MSPHPSDAHAPTTGHQDASSGGSARNRGVLILNWRDTANPEGGGSELYVERVAAGLAAQGRPVTLLCAAHPGAPAEDRERVEGVRILRRGGRLGVYLWAFLLHLGRRLGPHGVVIDVQNGLPFFSRVWCRRPVVVLVHHVHREQWGVVLPAPLAALGWWIESRLAPRLYQRARYVTVSEATRRELVGLGVRGEAITVVHNGVDQPASSASSRAAVPTICVLGRLVPHKRVEYALEAAARIRAELPQLKVLVVGQGHWELRLREMVARLGLEDTVELLGFVSNEAKHEILARSWVLAMPSLKEGWGLAVLEAATHATPTVAFRAAGGVAESVLHGETGLLAGDPEEFTRQLQRVLCERPLRERLGAAAQERSAAFTWARTVTGFAAVVAAAEAETEAEAAGAGLSAPGPGPAPAPEAPGSGP